MSIKKMSAELLLTFIDLASDDVFGSLSAYDVHNLACCHASVAAAVDARPEIQTTPDDIDTFDARYAVDEARLAIKDEDDIMSMLELARTHFARIVRRFVTLNARRPVTRAVIEELQGELCHQDTWFVVEPYSNGVTLFIEMMHVRVAIGASLGAPLFAMLSVTASTTDPCGLHHSWERSLALAYALMELTELPVVPQNVRLLTYTDDLDDDIERTMRNVIEHRCMSPHTGEHDDDITQKWILGDDSD